MTKRTAKAKLTLPCNDAARDAIVPGVDETLAQTASSAPVVRQSNRQICLELLAQTGGASMAEIGAATGWLPHSARAVLSGLRKQGHVIE
jgi:hypothetical protein